MRAAEPLKADDKSQPPQGEICVNRIVGEQVKSV